MTGPYCIGCQNPVGESHAFGCPIGDYIAENHSGVELTPYYQDDSCTIYHGDCRELLPSMQQAGLVFDDPPYLEGDWWQLLSVLQRAGLRLVVTPGAANAHEWTKLSRPFWTYAWANNSKSMGGSACLHIGWEPILAFNRPVKPLGTDLLKFPIETNGGQGHPWPKPLRLMRKLVQHFSQPADMVLDPHMGIGTTLRAAKDLGRKAIGIEIEERYCEIAAKRLAQEVLAL